jgi:ectoine hydroxylase-related dioxygenase (phytanoyl-CoA dioxygenase family)
MAQPLPLVAATDLAGRVAAVENDGYAYFSQILDADQIAQLRTAMDELVAIPASYDRHTDPKEHGFLNKSINNAFNRNPIFLPYLDMPDVIETIEALHGDDSHCIGMTAWMTGPGRPDQGLHTDYQALTLPEDIMADPRVKIPVFISTMHYYLDDLSDELGPTVFVPGSHRAGRGPQKDEHSFAGKNEQSIMCRGGDGVLFRSEVWHRGTANSSDQVRYLLQVHYAKRIITQKYPPYLNKFQFDADILARCNPRQLRLLGDHTPSNYD